MWCIVNWEYVVGEMVTTLLVSVHSPLDLPTPGSSLGNDDG